ncbi:MAG: nuclear transport factor 2 family protein [Steroidobacteraceae bacterium]
MSDLEDRFAIRELVERWSDGTNNHDWEALEALFSEDAVWDVGEPLNFRIQGRREIVAGLREKMRPSQYVVQMPHAIIVTVRGDTASARSTIHEVCRFADGTGLEMMGTYFDELVREPRGWRFRRRNYRCTILNPQPPAGQVFRTFGARE